MLHLKLDSVDGSLKRQTLEHNEGKHLKEFVFAKSHEMRGGEGDGGESAAALVGVIYETTSEHHCNT